MKKILTVSLVAMMAVTAANADIASTKYVDDRTGDITGLTTTTKTSLTAAVNELNTTVTSLNTGASTGVATQITNALKGATANDFSDGVKASLGKADTAVQTTAFETFKTDNSEAIADAKQEAIDAAALDATTKANAAESAAKTYADGLKTTIDAEYAAADAATLQSAKTYADGKASAAESSAKTYAEGQASAAQTAAEKTAGDALAAAKLELEGKITQAGTNTTQLATRVETIEKSAAYTSGIDSDKVAQIETNKTGVAANLASIEAINNGETGILAQAKADATSKANAAQAAAEKTAKDYTDAEVLKTTNALAEYKTEAANTFMDSKEVGDAITAAVNSETGALKAYSTTEQMNAAIKDANDAQTASIKTAYEAADATTLQSAQTYADQAEADAISTAKTFTTEEITKIINAAEMTDGTKVLTLKIDGETKTLGWETIGR